MLNSKLSLARVLAALTSAASAGVAVPEIKQSTTSRSSWARNNQTGSVFQVSRCKYLSHKEMTKKIKSANRWNKFISSPAIELTKTGRIKHEHDHIAAMRTI